MTEQSIQKLIANHFKNKAAIPNIYYNDVWEADLLMVDWQYHLVEFEIKVSKQDYNREFDDKSEKHNALDVMFDLTLVPNQFYYVCPANMIQASDVPNYAGLIWVLEKGLNKLPVIKKKAPTIHNEKVDYERWRDLSIKLAKRFC